MEPPGGIISTLARYGQGAWNRLLRYWPTAVVALALVGCEFPREGRTSVLLVAVEGLGFNSINCDADEDDQRVFCEESVRFSHAFTPSTMSQAALTSVLTGLYPFDHLVRTNGGEFLSARFRTLAEIASAQRYHTLFVSGGPPIWRKSGLAQGFEIFDDAMDLSPQQPYRPALDVVKIASSWIDQQRDGRPFFATLFLADLQFPQVATATNSNEIREKGVGSQTAEVMESLDALVKVLKSRKLWNRTNVVLMGLNSFDRSSAGGEPQPLSLKSQSTQVSLFIKPARKEGDSEINWAVDRNISLLDVSHTIFSWLGEAPPASSLPELQPRSLASVLEQPEPNWNDERLILSETAWPDWLEGAGVRWALRQKQFLYVHDRKPLIYNTLIDKLETLPIRTNDALWASLSGDVSALLQKSQVPPFRGMSSFWLEQLQVAENLWRGADDSRKVQGGDPWAKWYLWRALGRRKWREVKRLSQDIGEPVGAYVAARQMGEFLPMPRNPCVRLILASKGHRPSLQSECEDEKALTLYSWKIAASDEDRALAQERFQRLYMQEILDREIGRLNYLGELRWDVDREWPNGPAVVDYLLTLKEFEPLAKKLPGLRDREDLRL